MVAFDLSAEPGSEVGTSPTGIADASNKIANCGGRACSRSTRLVPIGEEYPKHSSDRTDKDIHGLSSRLRLGDTFRQGPRGSYGNFEPLIFT
jgi:hypothetical protein